MLRPILEGCIVDFVPHLFEYSVMFRHWGYLVNDSFLEVAEIPMVVNCNNIFSGNRQVGRNVLITFLRTFIIYHKVHFPKPGVPCKQLPLSLSLQYADTCITLTTIGET